MRLIHTGGTIGMVPSPQGLVPAKGVVEEAVGKRALVTAHDPLVDSAAIGADDWNRLLDLIETANDPVIVTHGTDTLAYTGAALSQALAGRDAPVILCGAMAPLGTGGDAEANLDLALSAQPSPGVWLAFAGRLMSAAGLVKHKSHGADSFRTVPQAPLSLPPASRFGPARIGILTLTPGIPAAMIEAALSELDGCVLRVFGAGTAPPDPALYGALSDAQTRRCALRAVSACEAGGLALAAMRQGLPFGGLGCRTAGWKQQRQPLSGFGYTIRKGHDAAGQGFAGKYQYPRSRALGRTNPARNRQLSSQRHSHQPFPVADPCACAGQAGCGSRERVSGATEPGSGPSHHAPAGTGWYARAGMP